MSKLTLDPQMLEQTANIIEDYTKIQLQIIAEFQTKMLSIKDQWNDDETVGRLFEEVDLLKRQAEEIICSITAYYPAYFREKALSLIGRPVFNGYFSYGGATDGATLGATVSTTGSSSGGGSIKTEGVAGKVKSLSGATGKKYNKQRVKKYKHFNAIQEKAKFEELIQSRPTIRFARDHTFDNFGDYMYYGVAGAHMGDVQRKGLPTSQGNNSRNKSIGNKQSFNQTCGPTIMAALLGLVGIKKATENEMVELALLHGLCDDAVIKNNKVIRQGGYTNARDMVELAKRCGASSAMTTEVSLDDIDKVMQRGGAMMIAVNDKHLSSPKIRPSLFSVESTHWIAITGVNRDNVGKIVSLEILDTGKNVAEMEGKERVPKPFSTISAEKFEKMRKKTCGFNGVCVFKEGN